MRLRDLAILVVIVGASPLTFACSNVLDAQLGKYGYSQLVPPSNFYPPGTILRVVSSERPQVARVCAQNASLGRDIAKYIERSNTAASAVAAAFTGNFELGANYLDQLKSDSSFRSVKKVKSALSNVYLLDLPTSEIFRLIKNRDEDCIKSIDFHIAQGDKVTIVYQALVADADYSVEYDSSVREEMKASLTQGVAASLAGQATATGAETFRGTELIWGIRDDQRLVKLSSMQQATISDRVLPINQGIASTEALEQRSSFATLRDSLEKCLSQIPQNVSTGSRMIAENRCHNNAIRVGTDRITGRAASSSMEDSLVDCLARIPRDASTGQRMLAEESCKRDKNSR